MSLFKQIETLRFQFIEELKEAISSKELESLKVKYLGKKGPVANLMIELKNCSAEEKPELGKLINHLKEELSSHCDQSLSRIKSQELQAQFDREWLDCSLPGRKKNIGRKHPITQMLQRLLDILIGMGFSVQLGPDVDTDYYNFEGLNFARSPCSRYAGYILFFSRSSFAHPYEQCSSSYHGRRKTPHSHYCAGAMFSK
jgi:phenylalanyl-tRNA synthetase alpha chain